MLPDSLSNHHVVELSHVLHPGMPAWPGDPQFESDLVASLDRDGFFLRRFSLGEHSGTHVNAPAGFLEGGMAVDELPTSLLVAPAIIIDVTTEAKANPDYLLRVDKLLEWEREYGTVPPRCIVLLYTGWQEKWEDSNTYLGRVKDGSLHFPGFDAQATGVLLTQRGVAGMGIDTHGVDGGQDTSFSINRRVLSAKRLVLENLCNLDQLPAVGSLLVIGILRLRGGSGSPASVLAFIPPSPPGKP